MIPIRLTIEGLYSYQERQTIDFANLVDAGLFGIFGTVGSGKSSILEAITFALYGETERLHLRDKRYYNMMNLKSNRSYIEFDFINFENRLFRSSREFKRNSKNFDDVKASSVVLYEYKNNIWVPLEFTNASGIIGLSYDNFKRTIIIPQGQFREFLELRPSDRTRMMKEIFGLHRFDLQDKVAKLNSENKSSLDQLNGRLLTYEEVSFEKIQEEQSILIDRQNQLKALEQEFQSINDKFLLLKNLKVEFEDLQSKKEQFIALGEQKAEMDNLQNGLSEYENVHQSFYLLLTDKTRISHERDKQEKELIHQQGLAAALHKEYTELEEKLKQLTPQFECLENNKAEAKDLELIAQIKQNMDEIEHYQLRSKNGEVKVKEVEISIQHIEQALQNTTKEVYTLKQQKLESGTLMAVAAWFAENRTLQEALAQQVLKAEANTQELQKIHDELHTLGIDPNDIDTYKEAKLQQIEEKRQALLAKKTQLDVQHQLSAYALALQHGEACPLCGALEHPHITEHKDVSMELTILERELQDCENMSKGIHHTWNTVQKLTERQQIFLDQLNTTKKEIGTIETKLKAHTETFKWDNFDPRDFGAFENKRKESLRLEQAIQHKEQILSELRANLDKEQKNRDKYNQALTQLKLEEAQKETQIQNNKSHLKILRFDTFQNDDTATLQNKHRLLLESIIVIEETYHATNETFQNLKPRIAAQEAQVNATRSRIQEIAAQADDLAAAISTQLALTGYKDITEIQAILAQQMDIPKTRQILEEFKIKFEMLKAAIQALEQKLSATQFDKKQYEELEGNVSALSLQVKSSTEQVTRLKSDIERLSKQYEEKKALLATHEKLQQRADNLKVMTGLFKGAGFVEYVSSIYLRQLCDHANVRFHRMTRNQLSLTLNENNDFEIIDYLNEGKSRSVKTLSGGQAFQVSLSLALALAESVQSNALADKNFFFIDEGFGTQDNESVNIVFETLLSLQKENRIVGIISHVDELKERIPLSITVRKDEEKGSLII